MHARRWCLHYKQIRNDKLFFTRVSLAERTANWEKNGTVLALAEPDLVFKVRKIPFRHRGVYLPPFSYTLHLLH